MVTGAAKVTEDPSTSLQDTFLGVRSAASVEIV